MAHHFTPSYMYIARYRGGHWTGQTLIMHEKRRGEGLPHLARNSYHHLPP